MTQLTLSQRSSLLVQTYDSDLRAGQRVPIAALENLYAKCAISTRTSGCVETRRRRI